MQHTVVFVSYCHEDQEQYKVRLLRHLKLLKKKYEFDIWHDKNIIPGDDWKQRINHALQMTKVAVLVVSTNFLTSDFILRNELPILLTAAERGEVTLVPVVVSACDYADSDLAKFQSVNDPHVPLDCLAEGEQEQVWLRVQRRVKQALAGFAILPSEAISSSEDGDDKKSTIGSGAYQKALQILNNRALDGKKRANAVLILADMVPNLNEVEKRDLRGELHSIRMKERFRANNESNLVAEYITLVLGLLDDASVINEMSKVFERVCETLPLHLQVRILVFIHQCDYKSV